MPCPRAGGGGRLLHPLAVVRPQELQAGAAYVHVYWGLLQAAAEEARLREDGDVGEPLLPNAEAVLHRRVALSGLQRPVVGGRHGEVPSMD